MNAPEETTRMNTPAQSKKNRALRQQPELNTAPPGSATAGDVTAPAGRAAGPVARNERERVG